MMCFANAVEPLRAANMILGEHLFQRTIITPDGKPVSSSSNLHLLADQTPTPHLPLDWLFVIASYDYQRQADKLTVSAIRQLSRNVKVLGSLDCGSWLLAEAGLLNHHSATIHWQELALFEERFQQIKVSDQRYVISKARVSAGGAVATLDLMLELIREQCGKRLFFDVRNLFLHDVSQPGNRRQQRHSLLEDSPPSLVKAINLMEATIENPLPLAEISTQVSISLRTLNRLFKQQVGSSPGQYYLHLRLKAARRLIAETRLGITDISIRCGFNSLQAFSRAFKLKFGTSPKSARRGRMILQKTKQLTHGATKMRPY